MEQGPVGLQRGVSEVSLAGPREAGQEVRQLGSLGGRLACACGSLLLLREVDAEPLALGPCSLAAPGQEEQQEGQEEQHRGREQDAQEGLGVLLRGARLLGALEVEKEGG